MRLWARRIFLLLALVEGIYVIAASAFLHTSLFEKTVNSDPQSVTVHFDSAWTLFPGRVRLRNLRIQGQAQHCRWSASLAKVDVSVSLFPLLGRRLRVTNVTGDGGSFELDFIKSPGRSRQQGKDRDPFRIEISDLNLHHFNSIKIGSYKYSGETEISGAFNLLPGKDLNVSQARVGFQRGRVSLKDNVITTELSGYVDGDILQWLPNIQSDADIFNTLSAQIVLSGKMTDAEFLNSYFKGIPWIKMTKVSGQFESHVQLHSGVFGEGSEASVQADRMAAGLATYEALGKGSLKWHVSHNLLIMEAQLLDYQGQEKSKQASFLKGELLSVSVESHDLNVRKVFSDEVRANARVRLPMAKVSSLDFLNRYIPAEKFKLTKGEASLDFLFNASTYQASPRGYFHLKSQSLEGIYQKKRFTGAVDFHTDITDVKKGVTLFKVSKAVLSLSQLRMNDEGSKPWSGNLEVQNAMLSPLSKSILTGTAALSFDDARPIFAILASESTLAKVLDKLVDVKNLKGQCHFQVGEDFVKIADIKMNSSDLAMNGKMDFLRDTQNIVAFVKWGILELGLDIEGSKVSTRLNGARKWVASRLNNGQ